MFPAEWEEKEPHQIMRTTTKSVQKTSGSNEDYWGGGGGACCERQSLLKMPKKWRDG
jgi:hypothetical protein